MGSGIRSRAGGRERRISQWVWTGIAILVPLLSLTGRRLLVWVGTILPSTLLSGLVDIMVITLACLALYRVRRPRIGISCATLLAAGMAICLIPRGEERFHLVLFGLLGYIGRLAFDTKRAGGFCAALSIGDELFQWFLPFRVGDLRDVVMNGAASMAGIALACVRPASDEAERR